MAGPLLALSAAAFGGGILLAGTAAGFPGWIPAVLMLFGVVTGLGVMQWSQRGTVRPVRAALGVMLSFFLLGTGWGSLHSVRVVRSPLVRLVGRSVQAWGSLEGEPERQRIGWTGSLRVRLVVPVEWRSQGVAVRDRVWLQGDREAPAVSPADDVVVRGTIDPLPPTEFGDYLRRRGYPAVLDVRSVEVAGPSPNRLIRAAWAVRTALSASIHRLFPAREAGLLMGISLGDTSRLDPAIEEDFRATGLSHLTAVSGGNLVMFLAPILGVALLVRLGRRTTFVVGAAATGFFVLLTGGQPSVLRAATMSWITMTGVFLGRPRSPPAIMGGAVLALLALDPTLAHAIGFQLSVAATAGMALLAGELTNRFSRAVPLWLALPAAATLSAQAGVTPLLLYHFGLVPSVTAVANVLAFPAVAPAMVLGLAAGCVGLASITAGTMLATVARLPLGYLAAVAHWLARFPFPIVTSPGSQVLVLVGGTGVVLAAAWWLRVHRRIPRFAVPLLLLTAAAFVWMGALRAGPPSHLTVTFFDVGQGDAALVRSPGGASILVDAGPEEHDVTRELAALGVRRLDLLVASHPHADHVAGLPSVLGRFAVALAVDPGCEGDSPFHADFRRAVRSAGVALRHPRPGTVLLVGDVRVEVLGPDRCFVGTESDANNDSLVLRVSYGTSSVLFSGDAEEPAQEVLLEKRPELLMADVLKVPHHGGDTSISEFLGVVRARVAVVSVGPNRYGHPVPSVLTELSRLGMRVFRTDRSGDVTVQLRGDEVFIQSSHG
ncbi:MAG TPA: DNA internalization-related competence protein ComEC/Rec2 [Actinomycetota bacterium]|nr:DNA internalization-related competence protein ComEC/Rec2 [Actinomycetota bacterium]